MRGKIFLATPLTMPTGVAGVTRVLEGRAAGTILSRVLKRVIECGRAYISNAMIRGAFVLRARFVNNRTRDEDVRAIVAEVLAVARELG
jgi:hypothetical protein